MTGLPPGGLSDDDQVVMRFGDAKALDQLVTDLTESLQLAHADVQAVINVLELDLVTEMTPHQVVVSHILPAVRHLMVTAKNVAAAEAELRDKLQVPGAGPEIDLGGGRAMRRVGQRLPREIARDVLGGKHAARRAPRRHT